MINVEVVYASEHACELVSVRVPRGSTVQDAISASGILMVFSELKEQPLSVGVFSRPVALNDGLNEGDRVEIYRPLKIDPKQARRARVLSQAKAKVC